MGRQYTILFKVEPSSSKHTILPAVYDIVCPLLLHSDSSTSAVHLECGTVPVRSALCVLPIARYLRQRSPGIMSRCRHLPETWDAACFCCAGQ